MRSRISTSAASPSRPARTTWAATLNTDSRKRKLLTLVKEGHVAGWDDPRMPTLCGIRRRGYTPEAIRNFVTAAGVSRTNGVVELAMLEHFVRVHHNAAALRRSAGGFSRRNRGRDYARDASSSA